ncbi:MAG: hypothetical protein H0V92_01025 [Pseudonocardiales bacterium]|nr:hypothetical protein [Pseudonocardiales bacterium]
MAQFIDPSTPLPTGVGPGANYNQGPRPTTWDSNQEVGLFEGGGTLNTGIYRPVETCRMNSNTPPYCPVCYTSIKTNRDGETGHHFRNAYAGHFYDGPASDLLLHHGTSIQLFQAGHSSLQHVFSAVERVPGSWQFMAKYLGRMLSSGTSLQTDFVGDWVGEWNLGPADAFEVARMAGCGQPQLYVHNTDWFGVIDGASGDGASGVALDQIYYRWIHAYRYGRNW